MSKKNKGKHMSEILYMVTGVTDIYCEYTDDNNCKIGFGQTYLLGIYNDINKVVHSINYINSDDRGLAGSPLEPFFMDNDTYMNYIIIERIFPTNRSSDNIVTIDHGNKGARSIYKFVNDDNPGYREIINHNGKVTDYRLFKVYNAFVKSDDGYDTLISVPIINFSNTTLELVDQNCIIKDLDENDFDLSDTDNEPNEVEFNEVVTDTDIKDGLKDFISNPDNSLIINNKPIKTSDDVDNLSDDDIESIKEFHNIDKIDKMDSFFMID